MTSDRKLPTTATIGLLNGSKKLARIQRFSPTDAELAAEIGGTAKIPAAKAHYPAERLAYVAFHKEPGAPPPPLREENLARVKIHLTSGTTFLVDAPLALPPGAPGFYATPADGASQFREIFFFVHAIAAREDPEPIGELLVRSGAATQEAIQRGLAAQQSERLVPIGQILVEQKRVDAAAVDEAATLQRRRRLRIGEVLVEEGLATPKDIELALAEQQRRRGKRLGEVIVAMGIVSEVALASALAKKFFMPFVDLDALTINPAAAAEIPRDLVEKYGVFAVDTDARTLTIAISDPLAVDASDVLRFKVHKSIREVVATPSQLARRVADYLRTDGDETAKPTAAEPERVDVILRELAAEERAVVRETEDRAPAPAVDESDSGVIKLANQVILDAVRRGASDIHIEPNGTERTTRVRFRVDGDCETYQEFPAAYRGAIVSRIKIMADLDISERRKPQDGKIRFRMPEGFIELRVATIPTVNGNEDVVMRILAGSKPMPLDGAGLSARNLREMRKIISKPYGLVLCVGPTGSGKTTTLHSALGAINTDDMKIWTAEDPVEITQPGLRQVQVHPKIGFTFATAMRAFLRADPDVIMVGEMRDEETAGTAVEASLTGHLVFSTLHTNSAPETITRLLDMGLDPFSFADALLGVLAQRLARSLCKACRAEYVGTRDEYDELVEVVGEAALQTAGTSFGPSFKLWKAVGCEACGKSGYKGRVAIHELLVTDEKLKRAIARKSPVDEIRRLAQDGGMTTLIQDGASKALAGITDMRQVLAVCSGR